MRLNLKGTTALADWLRQSQGERYVNDLNASSESLLKDLLAVCAMSNDPVVRANHAKFAMVHEHAEFLKQVLKSKGVDEDE